MTDQDNSSPDSLQHLLDEVGVSADPCLLKALGQIRELGAGPVPEPAKDLSTLFSADTPSSGRWSKRRITFLGGALAVSMGVGMSGVAADTFHLSAGGGSGIDSLALNAVGARVDRARADSSDRDLAARAPGAQAGASRDALVDGAGAMTAGAADGARPVRRSADADVENFPFLNAEPGAIQGSAPLARPHTPTAPGTTPGSTPRSVPAVPPEPDGVTSSSRTVHPGSGSAPDAGVRAHDTGVVVASGHSVIPVPVDGGEITHPDETAAAAERPEGAVSADRTHVARRAAGGAPTSPSSADPTAQKTQAVPGSQAAAATVADSTRGHAASVQVDAAFAWLFEESHSTGWADGFNGAPFLAAEAVEYSAWSVLLLDDVEFVDVDVELEVESDVGPTVPAPVSDAPGMASAVPAPVSDAPGSESPTPDVAVATADLPPDAAQLTPTPTPTPIEVGPAPTPAANEEPSVESEPGTGTQGPTETESPQLDPSPPLDPPPSSAENAAPTEMLDVAPTLEELLSPRTSTLDAPSEEPDAPSEESRAAEAGPTVETADEG